MITIQQIESVLEALKNDTNANPEDISLLETVLVIAQDVDDLNSYRTGIVEEVEDRLSSELTQSEFDRMKVLLEATELELLPKTNSTSTNCMNTRCEINGGKCPYDDEGCGNSPFALRKKEATKKTICLNKNCR